MSNSTPATPKLTIIHNHPDWIIVNKPGGISMQQEQGQPNEASLLQHAVAAIQKIESNTTKLWPVHRLDKATSGLVIFAKSAQAAATFTPLFSQQEVKKHYIAIALGKPKKKQGWVKGDMEKGRNGSWLLTRTHTNPAVTQFSSCAIEIEKKEAKRLYLIKPKTGKTHQIRVALKSIGCPILGDVRYKGALADRCYLHAITLSFQWQGQTVNFTALPEQGSWPELASLDLLAELKLGLDS
ncbi:MAG: TIGR01621 family pseudouridine synthase [Oleispira sp.]|nr:TIGR01621 family pseudouridine synthase [Oleispira sp.]